MTTDTKAIVEVVGELVLDDGATLEQQRGSQALTVARQIESALVPHVTQNPAYAPLWQQFRAAPQAQAPALAGVLQVLLAADAALAQRLDTLLNQYHQAAGATPGGGRDVISGSIKTDGGAYISGIVDTGGGEFTGRDKIVTTRTGIEADQVAALFDRALALARQKPPDVRDDLETAVETAKEEAEAGEDADKRLLSKMLDLLLDKGPDVLELVVDAILSPGAAVGKGARMLAKQARDSLAKKRQSSS